MLEIFLLRHGSTTLPHRFVGCTEVELSQKGVLEIRAAKALLHRHTFDTIFCSPMSRCTQTLEILDVHDDVRFDERIREICFGEWEKKSFDEICLEYPESLDNWSRYDPSFTFPGGENLDSFQKRVSSFAADVAKMEAGRILVISHGGVIRHLFCSFLKLPFEKYLLFNVDCGKIATLELYDKGAIMTGLNWGGKAWGE